MKETNRLRQIMRHWGCSMQEASEILDVEKHIIKEVEGERKENGEDGIGDVSNNEAANEGYKGVEERTQ